MVVGNANSLLTYSSAQKKIESDLDVGFASSFKYIF
jgi:hypothetical protein